jgi:hypothetical protein
MGTPLEKLTEDMTVSDLMALTEMLYNNVRTDIANGTQVDQETIRACNNARKEINACKKAGY